MPTSFQPRTTWQDLRVRLGVIPIWTIAIATVLAVGPQTASASDTATRWDSFSESSGCGEPFTRTPVGSTKGSLSDSEAILGPFGTYFGRSVAEVRSHLRDWTVPNSGGHSVRVHEEMLPALQEVGAALRTHAAEGRVYEISSAHAFIPRTIGGSYRISRHAMGLAIDLNPVQNPYRGDNVLISDMPKWFVDAWRDAGFCWGGDWLGSKDPMHFSWKGPDSTAGSDSLEPDPPDTSKTPFGEPVATHETEFGPVMSRYEIAIADANSNGTSDVVGLRSHPEGSVMDIALSSLGFGYCSIGRWFIPDESVAEADHVVMADVDGDSGQDLVALSSSGDSVVATTATRRQRYKDPTQSKVGASVDAIAFTGADFDGDHHADLWEVTPDGDIRIWGGPSFTQILEESTLPAGAPSKIAAGDRDGGNTPE
ncbi:MAG: M15 family metallopeptidase, partial [Actinomycetota bacterium]